MALLATTRLTITAGIIILAEPMVLVVARRGAVATWQIILADHVPLPLQADHHVAQQVVEALSDVVQQELP